MSETLGQPAEEFHIELFSETEVDQRIDEMAGEVIDRYQNENPLFVCFLKGGVAFTSKLMFSVARQAKERQIEFHPDVDYMTISTYGHSREANEPRIVMDLAPKASVKDRTVVMVDDLVDSGATAHFAESHMLNLGASRVDSIFLAQKENQDTLYKSGATILGFSVPGGEWLEGMGMNNDNVSPEAFRWAGHIAVVRANQD